MYRYCFNLEIIRWRIFSPSCQFVLPRVEKELYEREERAETQQEILRKVARNLPVYTRTAGGGEASTTDTKPAGSGLTVLTTNKSALFS